jgi:hypothetical protein
VLQRRLLVGSGIGLGLALAAVLVSWLPANHDAVRLVDGRSVPAQTGAAAGYVGQFEGGTSAVGPAPMTEAQQPSGATWAAPITMAVSQTLHVGEMGDLLIGLGTNAGVGEISFTLRFDANVLQARTGTEGDWAVGDGIEAHFVADISDAGDRVEIRKTISGKPLAGHGGSVALVQFQAIAPGTTSIRIADIMVKDLTGNSIAFSLSPSSVRVIVPYLPPPLPEAAQPDGATRSEALATEADTGD